MILGITAAIVVGLIFTLIYNLGAFKPVELRVDRLDPIKIVYKKHEGAYHKIVPVIEEVEKWAQANGEPCRQSFGEYLDNPDEVEEGRLHSNGGCIVEKAWNTGLPDGFEYRELASRNYVIADFQGSPSIGPQKVYPKAQKLIAEQHLTADGPVIEVYEILSPKEGRTRYLFPVR
jgi:DNA gyrase inhibitor GyrI